MSLLLLVATRLTLVPLVGLAQQAPAESFTNAPVTTAGRTAAAGDRFGAARRRRAVPRPATGRAATTPRTGSTDLRLVTDGGRAGAVPAIQPPAPAREWIRGSILSVAATKKTSGFEVDLGAAQRCRHDRRRRTCRFRFLKRLTLEGSGDRARWTMLVAEGTLFDLPDEQLRQNTLGFVPGPYRYLRVTWNDANSGRVPNPSAVAAQACLDGAPPPPQTTLTASIERRPSEPGISRFRVRLPAAQAADRRARSRRWARQ